MTPAWPAPPWRIEAQDGVTSRGRILVPVPRLPGHHLPVLLFPGGVLPGWPVRRLPVPRLSVAGRPVLLARIPFRPRIPLPPGSVHIRAGVVRGRPGRRFRLTSICTHRRLPPQPAGPTVRGAVSDRSLPGLTPPCRAQSDSTRAGDTRWSAFWGRTALPTGLRRKYVVLTTTGGSYGEREPPSEPLRSQVTWLSAAIYREARPRSLCQDQPVTRTLPESRRCS
jgi:hypothetical protein